MLSLIVGIIFFLAGIGGIVKWLDFFIEFVLGMLPISMALAGLVAIIAGITSISENLSSKKDEQKLKKEENTSK